MLTATSEPELAARSPPDGYTLLTIGAPQVINVTFYKHLRFNFMTDIAPVASIVRLPNVMVVNPSFPATNVSEFIAYARANPAKINFASTGVGSSIHVCGELFKLLTGIDMTHVPYRGNASALSDLMSGQVQVMFDNLPSSIGHVRTGRLRALAVTSAARWAGLPDIPSVGEYVKGFEASVVVGVGIPSKAPVEIVRTLNNEINAGLADQGIRSRLADLGGMVLLLSPSEYRALIASEVDKWQRVVAFSGITAD